MIQNVVRSVLLLPLLIVRCFLPNVIKINHVLGRFVGPNVPGDATKFLSILGNGCEEPGFIITTTRSAGDSMARAGLQCVGKSSKWLRNRSGTPATRAS